MSKAALCIALLAGLFATASPARAISVMSIYVVFFEEAKSELTLDAKRILDAVIVRLKSDMLEEAQLAGHTDRVGPSGYNLRLSCARAAKVRAYLVQRGIAPDRIKLAGWGEGRILVETPDEVAEPQNRRVELFVNTQDPNRPEPIRRPC